jgi:hypothetical protein
MSTSFFPLAKIKTEGGPFSVDSAEPDRSAPPEPSRVRYIPLEDVAIDGWSEDYIRGQIDAIERFLGSVSMKLEDEQHYEAFVTRLYAKLE